MSANATYSSDMDKALDEVAAWEQGDILNDHYNLHRYVARRMMHLANHPLYKDRSSKSFANARSDAAEVFGSPSQELSVQEVRRRELRKEIEPLLPLPTTENTQTIDSFRSFPKSEWTSEEQTHGQNDKGLRTPNQVNSPRAAPNQGLSRSSLESPLTSSPQRSTFNSEPTHAGAKAIDGSGKAATNSTMAFNEPQQTGKAGLSDMSSSPLPDSSFSSSFAINPNLSTDTTMTSMKDSDTPMQLEGGKTQPPPDQELIRKIIDRLGNQPSRPIATTKEKTQVSNEDAPKIPKKVYVAEGVSALGNRGMTLPVKRAKRTRNGTPNLSEQSDDNSESSEEVVQPPRSKKRKVGSGKMVVLPMDPAKLRAAGGAPAKASRKKESTTKPKTKLNHMESVISGDAIARTAAEATSAAETRLARLLANHNAKRKASKRGPIDAGEEPDFMPEYFNAKKFPKTKKGQECEEVRCVCGVVVDDFEPFIACDECGVWQHDDCMGVTEELKKEGYSCHVCEPWVHRELVAQLRKENPL